MTTEYQHVQVEQRGPALWVTLNRPAVRNAFNPAMIAELTALFTGVEGDGETRVVVLAGAGAGFCAGADLTWMREVAAYTHDENVADALRLVAMLEAVDGCAVPVVARVHGAALGGGVGLVAACDVAVAAADALFAFSEARLGIAPAVVAPFVLRKIGPRHARALFVPALRACKRLVAEVPGMSREEARAYTAEMIATLRASPEGQEGMRAFLEKRPPCFAKP